LGRVHQPADGLLEVFKKEMNPFDPIKSRIESGLTVIEASAGTGKTFSISHLVPRLLLENDNLRVGEILLVTYTNDAAGELADRTRNVFAELASRNPPANKTMAALHALMEQIPGGAEKIRQAVRELDLLNISTIHSFCQSVLQTEGELCALPVMPEVLVDWKELVRESLHDIWRFQVATNKSLADLAAMLAWDFEDDLDFVSKALALPGLRVEPDPGAFDSLLKLLGNPAGHFQSKDIRELEAFFSTVEWNKAGVSPEFRAETNKTLEKPSDLAGWHAAVQWVADLDKPGGAIKKTKGQDPHSRAHQLQAVQTAQSIQRRFKLLSLSWKKRLAELVAGQITETLKNNRLTTFDGMVATLDAALASPNSGKLQMRLREKFKVALVDESQDTDRAQFRIFKKIFMGSSGHSLVLIGDPKQAIYAFRGADVNTYLDAKKLAGMNVFTLSRNYRSPQPLVKCVNALFHHPRSFHKENLEFLESSSGLDHDAWLEDHSNSGDKPSPRLEAWVVPDGEAALFSNGDERNRKIAGAVASEIARLLGANGSAAHIHEEGTQNPRPVVPSDFAVLVSANHEAVAVHEALKAVGVPAIRKTDEDVFASDEAREMLALLVAVNSPLQAKTRRAALATRLLGKTDRAIREIEEKDADETVAKFQLWKLEWNRRGVSSVLTLIDSSESVSKRLAASPDGERRLTNFRHLTDVLSGFAAMSGGKPNRLLIWLRQEIARAAKSDMPPEEKILQLESDSLAVKVATMHSAKGLEFPLVFCPFLWTSKEPKGYELLNREGHFSIVDTNLCGAEKTEEVRTSLLEERLRLAYVALTRAKVKLWLCAGAVAGPNGKPSALDWLLRSDKTIAFPAWTDGAAANRGATHKAFLQRLAENLDGLCCLRDGLPAGSPKPYSQENVPIACRAESLPVPQVFWRVTSFSRITREKNAKGGPSADAPAGDVPQTPCAASNALGPILGGALLGTAVHDFLEKWNFETLPAIPDLEKHFATYPLLNGKDELPFAAAEMLGHLRESILPGMDCPVSQACNTPRTSEWQYHLPVAEKSFSIESIADVFRRHGDDAYAEALIKLGSEQLDGFLQGFIDKIASHNATFGVIDWKTNKLADYGEAALHTAARTSHYWLQTHLYLTALRRHLGPEAEIRGAWLVYLRGVRQRTSQGILHIRPTSGLLADLDSLFATPCP